MRTFIAFDFTEETKNTILKIQDNYRKIASEKITYTNLSQFHLTVFFLGEIGEKGAQRIIKILNKSEINNPISMHFDNIDYFPSEKSPMVIVLKSLPELFLVDIVKKIDIDLLKLGFKRDKKWLTYYTR